MSLFEIYKSLNLKAGKLTGYFPVYEKILKDLKSKPIVFVEVGVMDGGSLEMWIKYLHEDSRIIGVELNENAIKLRDKGYEIFIGDQSSPEFWKKFYNEVGMIDVLLDDGGHTNLCQIVTVNESINNINDGGKIIIEDVGTSFMPRFGNPCKTSFLNYSKNVVNRLYGRNQSLNIKRSNLFEQNVFSINFYDSIVSFEINRKNCFISKLELSGTEKIGALDYRFNHLEIFSNENNYFQKTINRLSRRIGIIYENFKLKKFFY
jgi:hypothetical protein